MTDRVDKAVRTIAAELRRVEDALADAEADLSKWGFSMAPSEKCRRRESIERLERRLVICQRAASILDEP